VRGKRFTAILGACVLSFLVSEVPAQNVLLSEWHVDSGKRAVKERHFDEAEQHYFAALKEAAGAPGTRVTDSIASLADLYLTEGKPAAAERLFRRALALQERMLGREHPAVAETLKSWAALHADHGQDETAERLYTQALAIQEKTLGPEHPDVATSLNHLAILYNHQGKHTCTRGPLPFKKRHWGPSIWTWLIP